GDPILVLAGKGHNGDDARAAQSHLKGREVFAVNVTDPAAALGEVTAQLARRPALVIDGLFGIGLSRPLDEQWAILVEAVNQSQSPVLAIDVPSGLDGDTGLPQGSAIRATVTLAIGAPKRGLVAASAWPYVGRL